MPQLSAGLLMYRYQNDQLQVFLVHPGGPYFRHKDDGHWGIPKGLLEEGEDKLSAAIREFEEETGLRPAPPYLALSPVQYRSTRKWVHAWAFAGEWTPEQGIASNTFRIEWPPRSGQQQDFPEVDRAGWFTVEEAKQKIHPAQWPLVEELTARPNAFPPP